MTVATFIKPAIKTYSKAIVYEGDTCLTLFDISELTTLSTNGCPLSLQTTPNQL